MKRNIIHEITSIKEREKYNTISKISVRLSSIAKVLNKDIDDEMLKYVPVALVACFESFFRMVVTDFIDFGNPFRENAIKFNQTKSVKFDFEIITAIESNKVTVGEFISHMLSWNNLDDINSNISTITNSDFLGDLKTHKRISIFESVNSNSANFHENTISIIQDIKRVFELRHIFCHEFTSEIKIQKKEIARLFANSRIFLNHADDYLSQLLYPNHPEGQLEMTLQAKDEFEKAESELNLLITKIKELLPDSGHLHLFDRSIELWKEYRTTVAELDAFEYLGGSIYPMIYSESLTATTEDKIDSLKEEFKQKFETDLK